MMEKETYFQFEDLLQEGISHLFTKRPFDFDKSRVSLEEIERQYKEIEDILKTSSKMFLKPIQTHTNVVKKVDLNGPLSLENVDGLVTNVKGVALVTSRVSHLKKQKKFIFL